MIKIDDNRKYLFFIGSGRTGSTLLGQLINYHPSCLISNESRFLQSCIDKNQPVKESLSRMVNQAAHEFNMGLEESSTHKNTLSRYQKDWIDMGDLSEREDFLKSTVRIIGDKKAGGNSSLFRSNPDKFCRFIDLIGRESVYFIQIIRNPLESIHSYTKSHNYSIEESAAKVIQDTQSGIDISKIFNNYFSCKYDRLLVETEETLRSIFSFLGEKCSDSWIEQISKKVSKKPGYTEKELLPILENKKIMEDINSVEYFKDILDVNQ